MKQLMKSTALCIALVLMFGVFATLILNSMTNPADYYEQMHKQYKDKQSQHYMETMREHEKEDKLREDCGFTMCK